MGGWDTYLASLYKLTQLHPGPLVVIEMPYASKHAQVFPSPGSWRNTMRAILAEIHCPLVQGDRYDYVLMGHSAGTDYCGMILNDPTGHTPSVLPSRLVLVDPSCFLHEVCTVRAFPFLTLADVRAKAALRVPGLPRVLRDFVAVLLVHFVVQDELTQEYSWRGLCDASDHLLQLDRPELTGTCEVLVCLSGEDVVIPADSLRAYFRAQCPEVCLRYDDDLTHESLCLPFSAAATVRLDFIAAFARGSLPER
eukprot:NODE_2869_length_862_cov_313.505576.p1 GENE.NODE_2869_length_862_cov_313.505576~~NODE_2869_length_862_cov_313.505576.p1  ORF type:complete len:252 (+),score=50.27 NODE_2869_length_862_cov_313.505576:3-758(+)